METLAATLDNLKQSLIAYGYVNFREIPEPYEPEGMLTLLFGDDDHTWRMTVDPTLIGVGNNVVLFRVRVKEFEESYVEAHKLKLMAFVGAETSNLTVGAVKMEDNNLIVTTYLLVGEDGYTQSAFNQAMNLVIVITNEVDSHVKILPSILSD